MNDTFVELVNVNRVYILEHTNIKDSEAETLIKNCNKPAKSWVDKTYFSNLSIGLKNQYW